MFETSSSMFTLLLACATGGPLHEKALRKEENWSFYVRPQPGLATTTLVGTPSTKKSPMRVLRYHRAPRHDKRSRHSFQIRWCELLHVWNCFLCLQVPSRLELMSNIVAGTVNRSENFVL